MSRTVRPSLPGRSGLAPCFNNSLKKLTSKPLSSATCRMVLPRSSGMFGSAPSLKNSSTVFTRRRASSGLPSVSRNSTATAIWSGVRADDRVDVLAVLHEILEDLPVAPPRGRKQAHRLRALVDEVPGERIVLRPGDRDEDQRQRAGSASPSSPGLVMWITRGSKPSLTSHFARRNCRLAVARSPQVGRETQNCSRSKPWSVRKAFSSGFFRRSLRTCSRSSCLTASTRDVLLMTVSVNTRRGCAPFAKLFARRPEVRSGTSPSAPASSSSSPGSCRNPSTWHTPPIPRGTP